MPGSFPQRAQPRSRSGPPRHLRPLPKLTTPGFAGFASSTEGRRGCNRSQRPGYRAGHTHCVAGTHHGDWLTKNLPRRAAVFDTAIAALVANLHERGLAKKVFVLAWGEFNRTPRVSKGGRDHWPGSMSVLLAGGNFAMGQVIGSTTEKGEKPKDRPRHPNDVLATVDKHLGIDHTRAFTNPAGPDPAARRTKRRTHLMSRQPTAARRLGIVWAELLSHEVTNKKPPQVLILQGLLKLPGLDSNQDKENQNQLPCNRELPKDPL